METPIVKYLKVGDDEVILDQCFDEPTIVDFVGNNAMVDCNLFRKGVKVTGNFDLIGEEPKYHNSFNNNTINLEDSPFGCALSGETDLGDKTIRVRIGVKDVAVRPIEFE